MTVPSRQWPLTDRVWQQFALLDRVMDSMRVDPVLAARLERGKALAEARNTCLACPVQQRCRNLLDAGDVAGVLAICPNARFFRQCGSIDRRS